MEFHVHWSVAKKFEEDNFNITGSGVYLIGFRDVSTNERHVLYVGQGEIGARLSDHFANNTAVWKQLNKPGRVPYYRFAACHNADNRLDIELGLYRQYGPERLCNEIEPPGSGRYGEIEVEETFT